MRTCANVAHGLGRRGGHEPLPEMGEYVCDCYEHGTGEPWAHVGSSHVHERIVRCRDCKLARVLRPINPVTGIPTGIEYWRCDYFWNADELPAGVDPDGFCAWGEREAE